jgi:hypothetical protein
MKNVADGVFRWIRTGLQTAPMARAHVCHFASGEILRRIDMLNIIGDERSTTHVTTRISASLLVGSAAR